MSHSSFRPVRCAALCTAIIIVAAFVLLLPATPAAAFTGCQRADTTPQRADFEQRVVQLVNQERANNGLPPGNPFYAALGNEPNRLNYYYLWYFIAASAARLTGASGWAADMALTIEREAYLAGEKRIGAWPNLRADHALFVLRR